MKRLLGAVSIVVGLFVAWFVFRASEPTVELADLETRDGIKYLGTSEEPFDGVVIESYEDGSLKSKSEFSSGLIHGRSEAFFENGQIQVSESFEHGVSQGKRVKWYEDGTKQSEGKIVDGKFSGVFRKWNESGVLVYEVELSAGVPDGISRSWSEGGDLRLEVVMENGKEISRKSWVEEVPNGNG